MAELARRFEKKTIKVRRNTLFQMKDMKKSKCAGLTLRLKNEIESRSHDAVEFRVEFRSFIISSPEAILGNTTMNL